MDPNAMSRHLTIVIHAWRLLILVAASAAAVVYPLELVLPPGTEAGWHLLNSVVTPLFLLDIAFSLYQARMAPAAYPNEEGNGIAAYLHSWFAIDLLAGLPFVLLIPLPGLSLLRLLKLAKVLYYMQEWRQMSLRYATGLSLAFFIYWLAIAAHWIGCGWLALRSIDSTQTVTDNYVAAVYWTITTLTTVGYGDITPVTNAQRLYAMVVQLLGIGLYGFVIGNIASILSKRDPAKAHYLESLDKLSALLHYRTLPVDLQHRIRDYYAYMWRQQKGYKESEFLRELPSSLQAEVSMHLKQELIEKIPLFRGVDPTFFREIAQYLKSVVLIPGDVVFHEGDVGHEMYFVVKGRLAVLHGKKEDCLSELADGDFFGEIALFSNKPRTASVRALSYCDLYSLDRSTFDRVVSRHDKIMEQIKERVIAREGARTAASPQPEAS